MRSIGLALVWESWRRTRKHVLGLFKAKTGRVRVFGCGVIVRSLGLGLRARHLAWEADSGRS